MTKKTATKTIKVLLADDHPIVMSGCEATLGDYDIRVVGKARTPEQAVQLFAELAPDVVVLDVKFGTARTGFDAAAQILRADAGAKIVFWSQCEQSSLIKEAYRLGARAFVTKLSDPATLAAAITQAHAGELFLPPEIAQRLANLSIRGDDSPKALLQERELEVFRLMAKGYTAQEIATELGLALRTITTVTQTVRDKLGVQRAADLTLLAVRYSIIEV